MKPQVLITLALAFQLPSALGQETPYDIRGCGTAETTLIDRIGDASILQSVSRGVVDSVPPGGAFDKTTFECRTILHASKEGAEFTNRCVFVDAEGHKLFGSSNGTHKGWQWRFMGGSGKWEGISGGGTGAVEASYPRLSPSVAGNCFRARGSFSLKK